MEWLVTVCDKKSIEEYESWVTEDKLKIIRVTGFRYGSWEVTTKDDNKPMFEYTDGPDGRYVDMNNQFGLNNIEDCQNVELVDGWYGDVVYPDEIGQDRRDQLEELWEEDFYAAWENEGLIQTDTELHVFCELESKPMENNK